MYRYYSIMRPVSPGAYPKPKGNPAMLIHNFDNRKFVDEIGREAWGYVEYNRPLTEKEITDYELKEGVK